MDRDIVKEIPSPRTCVSQYVEEEERGYISRDIVRLRNVCAHDSSYRLLYSRIKAGLSGLCVGV